LEKVSQYNVESNKCLAFLSFYQLKENTAKISILIKHSPNISTKSNKIFSIELKISWENALRNVVSIKNKVYKYIK
jgi:hypothetical protein